MKNDKINYKKLNEVISLSKDILKVFYVTMIVLIIVGIFFLLKELNVFNFLFN